MNQIIPTIFAKSKKEFDERFSKVIPISKNIQIDFMDGKFVKSKSIQLSQLEDLKKFNKNFEAHLMVSNPSRYIKILKQKGFKKIFFHFESVENPEKIIAQIKKEKLIPGIVFNPKTSFNSIIKIKDSVPIIMFMGHAPGVEKIPFDLKVLEKIKKLRATDKKIKIQIDGGATPQIIKKLAKAKVDYVNSGSHISNSKNPKQALKELNLLFNKHKKC